MASRPDDVGKILAGEDFLDGSSDPGAHVVYAGILERDEIGAPHVGYIDVITDASTVGSGVIVAENRHWRLLCPEMGSSTADVEIPEDAEIHSAVHDDPFAH